MTMDEVNERYNVPLEILQEYQKWGLCKAVKDVLGAWQYDDSDFERLSMIMTLHDIGFDSGEVETYMRLLLSGEKADKKQLDMLNKKRDAILDKIHFEEKQLERLDYIRYEIDKSIKKQKAV